MPPPQGRKPAVFLHDFVDVELPLERVRARVCGADGWLGPLAAAAADDGESLLVRLGPHGSTRRPGVELRVRLGECAARGEAVTVPIRWEASRLPGLFPVLDGALELAPLGDGQTRVLLQASYRPPLDGVGLWFDGAVLHRVAESTVRSFLHRVAEGMDPSRPPVG